MTGDEEEENEVEGLDALMQSMASAVDAEAENLLFQAIYGKLHRIGAVTIVWRNMMIASGFSVDWCEAASLMVVRRLLLGMEDVE